MVGILRIMPIWVILTRRIVFLHSPFTSSFFLCPAHLEPCTVGRNTCAAHAVRIAALPEAYLSRGFNTSPLAVNLHREPFLHPARKRAVYGRV